MPSKDVSAARTTCCAIWSTDDNDPNIEDPRHAIPKCLTEANEDFLDQMVDYLRSTYEIMKGRRRHYVAIVNAS